MKKKSNKRKDVLFITFDGASFDAHRHITTIKAIDHIIYDTLFTIENAMLIGYNYEEWLEIMRALKDPFARLVAFYPNEDMILFEGMLEGTTLTGDPAKTTLGNTATSWVINDKIKWNLRDEICSMSPF
jgi:hypothetical protein